MATSNAVQPRPIMKEALPNQETMTPATNTCRNMPSSASVGVADYDFTPWLKFGSDVIAATAWPVVVISTLIIFRRDLKAAIAKLSSLKAAGVEAAFGQTVDQMAPISSATPESPPAPDQETLPANDAQPAAAPITASSNATESPVTDSGKTSGQQTVHAAAAGDPENPATRLWEIFYRWGEASAAKSAARRKRVLDLYGIRTSMGLKEARELATTSRSGAVLKAWSVAERSLRKKLVDVVPESGSVPAKFRKMYADQLISSSAYTRYFSLRKLQRSVANADSFAGTEADVLQYIERIEDLLVALGEELDLEPALKQPLTNATLKNQQDI